MYWQTALPLPQPTPAHWMDTQPSPLRHTTVTPPAPLQYPGHVTHDHIAKIWSVLHTIMPEKGAIRAAYLIGHCAQSMSQVSMMSGPRKAQH